MKHKIKQITKLVLTLGLVSALCLEIKNIYNDTTLFFANDTAQVISHVTENLPSVIRIQLEGMEDGGCTAVVVSNKYAITAKHCLVVHPKSFTGALYQRLSHHYFNRVKIVRGDGAIIGLAEPVENKNKHDVIAIRGNFSANAHMSVQNREWLISSSRPYVVMGHSWNAPYLTYSTVFFETTYYEATIVKGYFVYGNSGSPVVDPQTGMVVAIATAIGDGYNVAVPLLGIAGMLNLPAGEF